jgi:hypothetical protein
MDTTLKDVYSKALEKSEDEFDIQVIWKSLYEL